MPSIMTSFHGRLVFPKCNDRFKSSVQIFKFDDGKGNILFSNEIILPSNLELIGVDSVLESLTGKIIPMLVLKSNRRDLKKDECIYYIFTLDFCCRNVLALRKLTIKYKLPQYSANPKLERTFLIDGPGIVWSSLSQDHLCIAVPSAFDQCELTVFPINYNEIFKLEGEGRAQQVINSVSILSVCLINNKYIIIGVFATDGCVRDSVGHHTEKQLERFFATEFGKESSESWRCKQLNPSMFLPPDYASIVSCLNVFKDEKKSSANNVSIWQVYAGTSEGYVLEVVGGHLTRCISISLPSSDIFLEANPIDCFQFLINRNQEISHIIVAQGQTISTVRTSDFKVHEQWSNIHHVFVDDFLQKHLPQVLLIQGANLTESSWILTDLSSHLLHIQHGSTHSEPSRKPDDEVLEPDQNMVSAVNALESRLQRERFAIQEKEKQLDLRHQLIVESFSNLQHQLEGQSLPERRPQMELLPLVQSSKPDTAPPPEVKQIDWVQVKCIWQRLVHDKWVIGVEFVNQSNIDLSKLSLLCVPLPSRGEKSTSLSYSSSLKLEDATKTSIHTVLHSSGPYHLLKKRPRTEFEDLLDKIESENENTSSISNASKLIQTFICTCNLPDFSSGPVVQLSLVWHYCQENIEQSQEHVKTVTENQSRNCQDDKFWNQFHSSSRGQEKSKMFTKVCGNVELNSWDVINKSWNVDIRSKRTVASIDDALDLSRDRIALDAAQQRTQVVFKFPAGIFFDLDKLLSSQCGFSFSKEFGCYICSSLTDFQDVRIQLSENTNQGETTFAEIYTCNDSELYLLVHHLYSCLPDCCLILPANSNCISQDVRLCLPPLTREVYFLSSNVRTILMQPEEQNNPVYMETDSESDAKSNRKIDVAKEAAIFKQMRESFHKVSEAVVEKRKLDELRNIWAGFREQTDKTVAKYCQ
ncbi:hypothetical protein CHS0354_042037 [Potamilus streckersoni]|uniref:Fanconi anemia group B protein n=1 Tax=Potamilus streckersoni TaxID=2493646 RepID=A0AAE0TAG4_9BIVA|nr:hypothetical protein CHS0354_042037 [Potamilus streckersoni]